MVIVRESVRLSGGGAGAPVVLAEHIRERERVDLALAWARALKSLPPPPPVFFIRDYPCVTHRWDAMHEDGVAARGRSSPGRETIATTEELWRDATSTCRGHITP
jgi:hypothetical protein